MQAKIMTKLLPHNWYIISKENVVLFYAQFERENESKENRRWIDPKSFEVVDIVINKYLSSLGYDEYINPFPEIDMIRVVDGSIEFTVY